MGVVLAVICVATTKKIIIVPIFFPVELFASVMSLRYFAYAKN
jgi:UDP-N-acetylmuramyl pentapeptide phosphotransferase/UDP-N-acetylglucosamine-1-phosphate transferase